MNEKARPALSQLIIDRQFPVLAIRKTNAHLVAFSAPWRQQFHRAYMMSELLEYEPFPSHVAGIAHVEPAEAFGKQFRQLLPAAKTQVLPEMTMTETGVGDGVGEPPMNVRAI